MSSFGPLLNSPPPPNPLEKVGTRQYHNDDAREQLVQTQIKSRHFIIILTGGQGLAVRRLFVFIAGCCFCCFLFCFVYERTAR
jgi:hypothetical protein